MQLSLHIEGVRADLAAVAAAGGFEDSPLAHRLLAALDSSFRMRLLDAIGEAAAELTAQLSNGRVEVRLAGADPMLAYVEDEQPDEPRPADEALSARITLRLPEDLKRDVEAEAASDGVSVNTWIVRALARERGRHRGRGRVGRGLSGFARS